MPSPEEFARQNLDALLHNAAGSCKPGLHLLVLMYTGLKRLDPNQDAGVDFLKRTSKH